MYPQHFGLKRPLFDHGIARDAGVFVGAAQRRMLEQMAIALTSRDSVVVLVGPPGTGKSTLAAGALGNASPDSRLASVWLSDPPVNAYEVLELLLAEFGLDPYKLSRIERLQTWRQFLAELAATDTRVFIAVEQAHDVDVGVLKALASLTAADPSGRPGANLVLMGSEDLLRSLDSLQELKQRVRLVGRFEAFGRDEVEAYLRHCVAGAGGDFAALFAPRAVDALWAYSDGIPRIVNNLCDNALALAAGRGEPDVGAATVTAAAVELCGMAEKRPAADESFVDAPALDPGPRETPGGPADDIPVLTESVEIDFAAADRAVRHMAARDDFGAAADRAAMITLVADVALDDLSAEQAEAILSADSDEPPGLAARFAGNTSASSALGGAAERPLAPAYSRAASG